LKTTATTTDKPDFFRKYPGGFNQDKSRKLTLDLIVSNNLQLSLVESVSFRAWCHKIESPEAASLHRLA
jgi:hypothetical protein